MLTVLTENLRDIGDVIIKDDLKRLNVDICTLQETRLAEASTLKDYTFY